MLIDSHCHLDNSLYSSKIKDILSEASSVGVKYVINPGVNVEGWPRINSIAMEFINIYAAFGIHPMSAAQCSDKSLALLELYLKDAVAVGEIGLDYHTNYVSRELQISVFRAQLQIAVKNNLPVIIHCRNAFNDILRILREEQANAIGGVMHAFSGSVDVALEFIKLGFCISIAGPVTWQNAIKPLRLAAEIPLEHILLETDSPDLSPERNRGQINRPAYLLDVALKVAEIKKISQEMVEEITFLNTCRLFKLKERVPYE
jgi:TatD DNase family protein